MAVSKGVGHEYLPKDSKQLHADDDFVGPALDVDEPFLYVWPESDFSPRQVMVAVREPELPSSSLRQLNEAGESGVDQGVDEVGRS